MPMIRVGVVGTGGMGSVHARHYAKMADVELIAFDADAVKLDSFMERFQVRDAKSFEEVLELVDAVDLCLPTDLHAEYGLRCLRAGKPVLIEKPLARTLQQGRELLEAAANAWLMPGQVVRYFREYAAAHKAVKSGVVGNPAAVRMRRGGLAPQGGVGWFMDHNRSGGVLLDLAVHEFDWLHWTFGPVESVFAQSVAKNGHGPDYALAVLKFESGVVGHVEATWMDPSGFRAHFEVCGSGGMIEHDSRNVPTLRAHAGGKTVLESNLAPEDDPFYNQLRHFADCVEGKVTPNVSAEDGFNAMAIGLAALESAQTGWAVRPERA